ncbi:hypothetical protein NLU13_0054 [Sarocladium strictum]|uniref:Uncharacterized protein n=1 Tax=Sarocladium strictum TaxID=5046 RepID=A0AA39GNC8_SARSR|nr:hypothetical protein NLU13_0054 [Sarocladium strictum]
MSELPIHRRPEDVDAEDGGDGLPSFEIGLFDVEHPDENFRTQNNPHDPYQRTNVVQRQGAFTVKCRCVDVIHGRWEAGSPERASLIVLKFDFSPCTPGRRIKHAEMEFRFKSSRGPSSRDQLEVAAIAPDGHISLVPTTRSEEHMRGVEGTAGGGALGLQLSGTVKWERKNTQETSAATVVSGSTFSNPEWLSKENCVAWNAFENGRTKTGIPAMLQVGILVKRPKDDDDEFQCAVKLKTSADFKTQWGEVFKKHQGDDELIFKPSLPPTNKLMKYDAENLGRFDVALVGEVNMTTVREDAIKTQRG